MIKRTIEISRESAHLCVRHDQLVLKRDDRIVGQFPCEDVGVVVVDHPQATYSHQALAALAAQNATLVVCGKDHLPVGILLPLSEHSQVVWRLREQIAVSVPLRKRLWQQIVQCKIRAQARNLDPKSPPARRLREMVAEVRSGDPTNVEAQAARLYWSAWLVNAPAYIADQLPFHRDPDQAGVNALLNYGYAILRAAIARALVSGGLAPALGLHHRHRANAFCLADDLLEPFRPLVDARVRGLAFSGQTTLDQPTKAALLELLAIDVRARNGQGPLFVQLHSLVASLVECFQGQSRKLEIPQPCESVDTAACGS